MMEVCTDISPTATTDELKGPSFLVNKKIFWVCVASLKCELTRTKLSFKDIFPVAS